MPANRRLFRKEWLLKYTWILEGDSKSIAVCKSCKKNINIASMGEAAIASHAKSDKHQKNLVGQQMMTLKDFGISSTSVVQETAAAAVIKSVPLVAGTVNNLVNRNQAIMKAEILWTLKTVTSHCSYKSNENINDIFQAMFPDSAIAKGFRCGERKTAYFCVFGLAEHFKKAILSKVKGHFVIMFDESLNQKMQEKQLDIHVRYWDSDQKAVVATYLGSRFMGKFFV